MKETNLDVDMSMLLDIHTEKIKKVFNCIQVGKIIKFYPDDKTADVNICFKQKVNDKIIDYPLLLNCLVVGNKITLPIEEGEFCVVLFNDCNLDSWFETGENQIPYTNERHCISDGIVIPGLNSLINKIVYDNDNINLTYKSNVKVGEDITLTGTKDITLTATKKVVASNSVGSSITLGEDGLIEIKNLGQSLFTILNTLITTLINLKTGTSPSTASFVIDQNTATTLNTLLTNLALLLK